MALKLDRRNLIGASLALGAAGISLPRMAFAQAAGSKNMLFVILRGAADGLAMLAPVGDPNFARLREASLPDYSGAQMAGSFFAIHPALREIGQSYAKRDAVFVHAVATNYRERSHFDGQNLLETGSAIPYSRRDGWLNRLVAMMPSGPPKALAIAPTLPLAMRGEAPVSSYAPSALPQASDGFKDRVARLYASDEQLSALWTAAIETQAMASDTTLRNLRDAKAAGELTASLMRDPDGARIAMIELDGWDSHANQRGVFQRQASQLDALLGAYRDSMGDAWSDTLVMVATEFGRTVRFNGTNGTDHGTASAALVMGGAVAGGRVISDWPGLRNADLFEGRDLHPTMSVESVLAGAMSEHFTLEPSQLMSNLFPSRTEAPLTGLVSERL